MFRFFVVCLFLSMACAPVKTVRVCSAMGCGSGFINESGGVTTAAHNVRADDVSVSESWYRVPSKVLKSDYFRDIAWITGIRKDRGIKYCEASVGDDVTAYVQLSQSVKYRFGGMIVREDRDSYVIAGYHADYGHSGSPVVLDRDDCVIGIVIARYLDMPLTLVSKIKKGK